MPYFLIVGFILFSFQTYGDIIEACSLRATPEKKLCDWREELNCRDLEVGEIRRVDKDGSATTGLRARYILEKTGAQQYRLNLPLVLSESGLGGRLRKLFSMAPNETEKEMEKKIKDCTQNTKENLKGPDGESIELNPIFSRSIPEEWKSYRSDIKIVEASQPISSAHSYKKGITCSAIIHELLHLTGLVDEYSESDLMRGSRKFSCRVLGPISSVMGDSESAYELVTNANFTKEIYEISGRLCRDINQKERTCFTQVCQQEIALRRGEYFGPRMAENILDKCSRVKPADLYRFSNIQFKKLDKKVLKSLIKPAHFRAIVYPGCQKKNVFYYKCARFAYMSTLEDEKNDSFEPENQDCQRPKECLDGSWLN